MRIEEMETHTTMYDALTLAEKAGRTLQKDIENYEDIMEKLEEQKVNHEAVSEFIKDKGGRLEDDSELMEELERLEAGSVEEELSGKVNISQIKAQK
jgi:predicted transcriptional regulator